MADDDDNIATDGFDGYVETSVDPGMWLLLITTLFCFFVMLVVVPLMVVWKKRGRHEAISSGGTSGTSMIHEALHKKSSADAASAAASGSATTDTDTNPSEPYKEQFQVSCTCANVARFDPETRKILGLAGPFTLSALASSVCSSACLILVSRYVGTKAAAAYAIVQVLVGLSDGVLRGPISACTTLCAHAVGSGNSNLAGEYIQLAITFYTLFSLPVVLFWCIYMYQIVLYLEWGDHDTAQLAQDFVRIYIFSYLFSAISSSVWQLLEITEHAVVGTIFSMIWGACNVLFIGIVIGLKDTDLSLKDVAWVYNGTSLFFILFTYVVADYRGWLKPFKGGLFGTCAVRNLKAIKLMLTQALPLSFGYLLSNAEWAVLTFMASHLGPAEVAAWAILGSIWSVFYTTTAGIGDAAEIRVSHHLGENSPSMAQLSAYKSLFLGMVVASIVSLIYFSLQDQIPAWFTKDETLQGMLRELVPFVGVANLTMTFGMQCWSLIGSQGKYSLATWVNFISSWGICMPLAGIFTFVFRIDLQGLAAAATIGYVSTGATLSYILLGTDWYKVARKIQERNAETTEGKSTRSADDELDGLYASMIPRKKGAQAAARRNIRLLTVPAGKRSGLIIGNLDSKPGNFILRMRHWSPLRGQAHVGNSVLAINGHGATRMSVSDLSDLLKDRKSDRVIAVVSPDINDDDEDDEDHGDHNQSGVFWNEGVFGYLAFGNNVNQTSDDYEEDYDDQSYKSKTLQQAMATLSKYTLARQTKSTNDSVELV